MARNSVALPSKEIKGEELQKRKNIWELIQTFDLWLISFFINCMFMIPGLLKSLNSQYFNKPIIFYVVQMPKYISFRSLS